MGSKRKSKGVFGGGSGGMKFRTTAVNTVVDPGGTNGAGAGTRPLAEAATVCILYH